jgi:hypothetical protein
MERILHHRIRVYSQYQLKLKLPLAYRYIQRGADLQISYIL